MKRIGFVLALLVSAVVAPPASAEEKPRVVCGPNKQACYWTNVCVIGTDGYGYCGERCWQIAQSLRSCLDPPGPEAPCERLRLKNQACARGENPDAPPPKTGTMLTPAVDALAYSASPRGGVEPADPCQRAREAERIACAAGGSRCKEAQREAREACPPRGLSSVVNVLVAIVGAMIGEGEALAAPAEQGHCDAAVAGAIECDDNGWECSSQRAAVAQRCKAPLIQQWLTSSFMTHFYPSREYMSVDEFIGWLTVDGTVRDCQNLVGPMAWASALPAVFLGHAEVSVPWRNAGYALSQRIKNGPCAHRWRE